MGPRFCLRGLKSSSDYPQRMLQKVIYIENLRFMQRWRLNIITQGPEMGQGPARMHPLFESHLKQQSWFEEAVWTPRGADASRPILCPIPSGRNGGGRQIDGRYLFGAAGGTWTCVRSHYHQRRTKERPSLPAYYWSPIKHGEWHANGERKGPETQPLSIHCEIQSLSVNSYDSRYPCAQFIHRWRAFNWSTPSSSLRMIWTSGCICAMNSCEWVSPILSM